MIAYRTEVWAFGKTLRTKSASRAIAAAKIVREVLEQSVHSVKPCAICNQEIQVAQQPVLRTITQTTQLEPVLTAMPTAKLAAVLL